MRERKLKLKRRSSPSKSTTTTAERIFLHLPGPLWWTPIAGELLPNARPNQTEHTKKISSQMSGSAPTQSMPRALPRLSLAVCRKRAEIKERQSQMRLAAQAVATTELATIGSTLGREENAPTRTMNLLSPSARHVYGACPMTIRDTPLSRGSANTLHALLLADLPLRLGLMNLARSTMKSPQLTRRRHLVAGSSVKMLNSKFKRQTDVDLKLKGLAGQSMILRRQAQEELAAPVEASRPKLRLTQQVMELSYRLEMLLGVAEDQI